MTSRQARRSKKKRKLVAEAAFAERGAPPEIISIVEEYLKELLTLPVESFGSHQLGARLEFAERKAAELLSSFPASLCDQVVQEFLVLAGHDTIQMTYAGDFTELLECVAKAGVMAGINVLLQNVEARLAMLPDDILATFSVDDRGAETFRSLSKEFAGTFDELIETAKVL
jgi:hypothetical protein